MEYVNANKLGNSKGMMKKKKNGSNKSKTTTNLSTDPQSVAARQRRHRISDRFKILQSMVPGGTKMDTASMLEEAINYVKFLKAMIWFHENVIINFADHHHHEHDAFGFGQLPVPGSFPCFPESLALEHVQQQADAMQASEPLVLQDFNGLQDEESETLMYLDDGFMKY